MQIFLEAAAALLAAAGLFLLGRGLLERLLSPAGPEQTALALIPAAGDGAGLEQRVRTLLRLNANGSARFTVVIADCGLSGEGRALAQLLLRQRPEVLLCAAEDVGELIRGGQAAVQGPPEGDLQRRR